MRDQEDRANARRTERDARVDGGGLPANQKRMIGKMRTMFEGNQHVTVAV